MSDRAWLPTRKGTDLFPNVIQAPAKLVIKGVEPDTPLYYEVVSRFSGPLKQFHAKAQQTHALSSNPITKVRQFLSDDARATYTNIHGQELLELEVRQSTLSKISEESVDYWDFALIELYVPDMYYVSGGQQLICAAHLTMPVEQRLDPADNSWPLKGVALATGDLQSNTPEPDALLNTAEFKDIVRTDPGAFIEAVASFALDLRPLRGLSAVTVDLHPYIFLRDEVIPGGAITFTTIPTVHNVQPPSSLSEQNPGYLVQPEDPTPPAIYFNTTSNRWEFAVDNSTDIISLSSIQTTFLDGSPLPVRPDIPEGKIYWWIEYRVWTGNADFNPGFSGPNPIPAEVQLTLFKGVPKLDVTNYADDNLRHGGYMRWTFPDIFPQRVGFMRLANVGVPGYTDSTFPSSNTHTGNLLGIPKLGSVIISPQMDKGVAWQKV